MGKVSTLNCFLLELECEEYSFFDQAVDDLEHSVDSIKTPEWARTGPTSVSSGFLCLFSTNADLSKLQPAPHIESNIL